MYDVAIVGMGLAGSIAATCLGRAGYQVALIGRYVDPPNEFAAEQIVGTQVEQLRHLGVLGSIVQGVPEIRHVDAARNGRIFETMDEPHYGLSYRQMVQGARNAVPDMVTTFFSTVSQIERSADRQVVRTVTGSMINARLVILATGVRPLEAFGIGRHSIRKNHSLTIGLDIMDTDYRDILAYFPERFSDRIDYLTLFPLDGGMRANLFLYREVFDPWVRDLRLSPNVHLREMFPGLGSVIGLDYFVGDNVDVRPVSLYMATELDGPGVVVIGGAYQSSCPAVGSGIGRICTDVDLLCNVYIPRWLGQGCTTPMTWDTFKAFYNDPIKRGVDAEALRAAQYRRQLATETNMWWKLHRGRVKVQNRVRKWTGGKAPASAPPAMMAGV